jgi:hypothetical protein
MQTLQGQDSTFEKWIPGPQSMTLQAIPFKEFLAFKDCVDNWKICTKVC